MSADISQMQFWGVEVKPGQSLKVDPFTESEFFDSTYIHLSQAALGEAKKDKGSEPVVLYVTFGGQKLVLGTLSKDNVPQLSFDLVLEKEFELSHNWKNGSVYFLGYKAHTRAPDGTEDEIDDYSGESEDEDLPLPIKENGKPAAKTEEAKPAAFGIVQKAGAAQKQVKVVEPKKDQEEGSEDDEDDESESSDEDMMEADGDDDEDSDSDDEEDTPPTKGNPGKKRVNDSASKTPVPAKKAKSSTPQKTDVKKDGHTATPHPMKKGGKTPNSDSKDQTPKSGGQFSCKSCSKTFTSEAGLQQHAKAKHGGQ